MQVDGYSLDAQRDKLTKYAEYQDMEVVKEFSDAGLWSESDLRGRRDRQLQGNGELHIVEDEARIIRIIFPGLLQWRRDTGSGSL